MTDLLVWNELGNIYFRLGAYDEAIAVYEKAIEQAPGFGWPYSNLGLVHAHRGEYAQAIPLYLRSLQLFKKDKEKAVSWNRLGDAYRRLNDPRGAMAAYQKAVELDVGELEKAVLAAPGRRPAEPGSEPDGNAGTRLDELKLVDPRPQPKPAGAAETGVATWLNQLAVEQDASAVSGEVDQELQTWLKSAPKRSPSTVLPTKGERKAPNAYWVLEADPSSAPEAVEAPLVKWEPGGPGGMGLAAAVACAPSSASQTQVDEMEPPERFACLVNETPQPESAPAPAPAGEPSAGAEKKRQTGKLEDAAAAYARIAESSPGNDRAWDALGNSLRALGRYDEAVEAFKEAISRRPNNEEYPYHLGLVYAAQKRHVEAVEAFKKVIQLNPEYILAHCALAGSLRRLGREAEADEHIAVARPAIQAEKEYNRACFEVMCGNADAAIELLKAALVTRQTPVEWMRSDPDLEILHDDPRFQALLCQEA